MKRTLWKVLGAAVALALPLAFTACGAGTPKVENPETVSVGIFTEVDSANLLKEEGWFDQDLAKSNVKVKWVNFQAGRDINNAFAAKSIDLAVGIGDPPVTIGVSSKIDYQVFWIMSIAGDSEALVVRDKLKITSVKGLKGKKIATTVSSTSHYSLLSALQLEGLTANDVQIVDLNPPDILAAWQRKDIDAAYTWDPNLSVIAGSGGKILLSSKDLAAKGFPTTNYGVVSTDFAQKYPHLVKAFIEGLIKANDQITNEPDKAAEVWAKELSIDKAEALKQAKGQVWLSPADQLGPTALGKTGAIGDTAKNLKKIGDFLVDQKSLSAKEELATYEKVVNPKYLEDAVATK